MRRAVPDFDSQIGTLENWDALRIQYRDSICSGAQPVSKLGAYVHKFVPLVNQQIGRNLTGPGETRVFACHETLCDSSGNRGGRLKCLTV